MISQRYAILVSAFILSGLSTPGLSSEIGGWSTGGIVEAWADFAIPPFDTDQLFLLSCTENVDEELIEYLVVADDRVSPITFSEGGKVLVEARAPRVQQYTPGTPARKTCEVRRFPDGYVQSVSFPFETRHAVPELILLLNPDRQRRFRIDFNFPNLTGFPGCSQVTLRPMVNGREVTTPDNNPLNLQVGTSFWGMGHSVVVTTADGGGNDCPVNVPIGGTITVHPG